MRTLVFFIQENIRALIRIRSSSRISNDIADFFRHSAHENLSELHISTMSKSFHFSHVVGEFLLLKINDTMNSPTWMSITRCNSFMPSGVFDQGINFSWRRLSSFHLPWTILRVANPYYTTNPIIVQYLISKIIVIMGSNCDLGKSAFDWRNSI